MKFVGKYGPMFLVVAAANVTSMVATGFAVKFGEIAIEKFKDWRKNRAITKAAKDEIVIDRK